MNEFETYLHDALLDDIAFDDMDIAEFERFRTKYLFDPIGKSFSETIQTLQAHKKGLIDEYQQRYGKPPDLENAKRLFLENQRKNDAARGPTGDVHNNNAVLGQKDLGHQTPGINVCGRADING